MKKLVLCSALLTAIVCSATTEGSKPVSKKELPTGYRKAFVSMTIQTEEKSANGEYKNVYTPLCSGEIFVPVYRPSGEDTEMESNLPVQNFKKCVVNIDGLEASVIASPYIFETKNSKLPLQEIMKHLVGGGSNTGAKLPHWLQSSIKQANGEYTAFMSALYVVPKNWDRDNTDKMMTAEEAETYFKLSAKLGEASTQVATLPGRVTTPMFLMNEIRPSQKYCDIEANKSEKFCSLRYTIRAQIIMQGK